MEQNVIAREPWDAAFARRPWLAPLLILAVAAVMLLPGNNVIPLIDRDEPMFAQATREMMQHDSWVVPTFNGDYFLDKPVLTYWLMGPAYVLFGVNEFGARFHSALSAALLALVIYFAGRRWFSVKAGLVAALGLLTCLQVLIHGRSSVADMPMILFLTTAQWALFELLKPDVVAALVPSADCASQKRSYNWGWFLLLYISLGLGFLAKGPIAWIVPILTLILWRWLFGRQPLPWSRLKLHLGLPITLAILAAWGIPALIQTHGAFWSIGIGRHIVERGTKMFNKRPYTPFYYLLVAAFSLYPWIAYVPRAVRSAWTQRKPVHAFLLSWLIAPYIIFSIYKTQLPHYVMPAFPALFLLLGCFQGAAMRPWEKAFRNALLALGMVVGVAMLAYGATFAIPEHAELSFVRSIAVGLGLVLFGLALVGLPRVALRTCGLLAVGSGLLLAGSTLRAELPALRIRQMLDTMPRETELGCWAYREPSLTFYCDHNWQVISDFKDAAAFLAKPGPRLLVVPQEYRDAKDVLRRRRDPSMTFTNEIAQLSAITTNSMTVDGFNAARSQCVNLRVFYKR